MAKVGKVLLDYDFNEDDELDDDEGLDDDDDSPDIEGDLDGGPIDWPQDYDEVVNVDVEGAVELDRSETQIASQIKYRQTEKGKETISRVNGVESAREARARYSKSAKGRLAQAKYRASEKAQMAKAKRRTREARAILYGEREEAGLCGLCGEGGHRGEFHLR